MVKHIKQLLLYIRCKRAIKQADRMAVVTGKKILVLMLKVRPVVLSKQHLERQIRQGAFIKGFTAAKAEELAIYKAYKPCF